MHLLVHKNLKISVYVIRSMALLGTLTLWIAFQRIKKKFILDSLNFNILTYSWVIFIYILLYYYAYLIPCMNSTLYYTFL